MFHPNNKQITLKKLGKDLDHWVKSGQFLEKRFVESNEFGKYSLSPKIRNMDRYGLSQREMALALESLSYQMKKFTLKKI